MNVELDRLLAGRGLLLHSLNLLLLSNLDLSFLLEDVGALVGDLGVLV